LRRLVFGASAGDAVAAPRFYAPPVEPALVYSRAELPDPATSADLLERGEQVRALDDDTSAVQMITIETGDAGVSLEASADPRKAGTSIVR
jgi:gamma-glutamyltranspeptidase